MDTEKLLFRDGVSQERRMPGELDFERLTREDLPVEKRPVSVDERTAADLLEFAQKFAGKLRFFDRTNTPAGDWTPFFEGDVKEIIQFMNHPEAFLPEPFTLDESRAANEPHGKKIKKFKKLSQPHRVLFLAFLHILRHPLKQFRELTPGRLGFYYRDVLKFFKKPENPDRVHVIFQLSTNVKEHRVEKGALLDAGRDSLGVDLRYAVESDVIVNRARVASIKTVRLDTAYVDLKKIHERYGRSDKGFEMMLRQALGCPRQGEALPLYSYTRGGVAEQARVDAPYLESLAPDGPAPGTPGEKESYIRNSLYFSMDDFEYCIKIHAGETSVKPDQPLPSDEEWRRVYKLVEKAYGRKILQKRQEELKEIHGDPDMGFSGMMRYALGDPNPGDPLPRPPGDCGSLDALYARVAADAFDPGSAPARYVKKHLFMSVEDFRKIMEERATGGSEVYRLLEKARSRKRTLPRPRVGKKEIRSLYAATVAESKNREKAAAPGRFKTFGEIPVDAETGPDPARWWAPGFAAASPVLLLREGVRIITLTLSFEKSSFDRDKLKEYLEKHPSPFHVLISGEEQWTKAPPESVETRAGDFILDRAVSAYDRDSISLVCTSGEDAFQTGDAGRFLLLPDGMIYTIAGFLNSRQVKLRHEMEIGLHGAARIFQSLTLGGAHEPLKGVTLFEDRSEAVHGAGGAAGSYWGDPDKTDADQGPFDKNDRGKFIVWKDRRVHVIQKVVDDRRVVVRYWGSLPETIRVDRDEIHDRISFDEGGREISSDVEITGLCLEDALFEKEDSGKLIVWSNGLVLKIGNIHESMAAASIIDREAPGGEIEKFRAASGLRFTLRLDEAFPGILPPLFEGAGIGVNPPCPVVKFLLENTLETEDGKEIVSSPYEIFKSLCLERATIDVKAERVRSIRLRNDHAVISPESPFEPFGHAPAAGAALSFSNTEICRKKLNRLDIRIQWMGMAPPGDLQTRYHAYSRCGLDPAPPAIDDDSFKVRLRLLNNRSWTDVGPTRGLFAKRPGDATLLQYREFDRLGGYDARETFMAAEAEDPRDWPRRFKLVLDPPDFQHAVHPLVLNKVALSRNTHVKALTVYPPYTPRIQAISLAYESRAEIDFRAGGKERGRDRIVQLHPFGAADVRGPEEDEPTPGNRLLPPYGDEGSLYIGLAGLDPPRDASLLFQLVGGSANPGLKKSNIRWSFLTRERWEDFTPAQLLSDETDDLTDSGVIRFSIPGEADNRNPVMPAGLHWIRASTRENSAAAADAMDIRAQAATAIFQNRGNAPDHLKTPLAAGRIKGPAESDPAVAGVIQPYSSFDGKPPEDDRSFYTRVSERLRHKQRAVTTWDYERLVLERFPEIYKAKCLNQEDRGLAADLAHAPGSAAVEVIVIPDVSDTAPFFPLEPRAPSRLLKKIDAYLKARVSPFVRLTVKNPRYEQITYRIAVRFRKGFARGFYLEQLNTDLKRLLSPWAYKEQKEKKIFFGVHVYNSSVIHFIEKREYVDYVASFKLFEQASVRQDGSDQPRTMQRLSTSTMARVRRPDSILVSAPFHVIDPILTEDFRPEDFEGVGYMMIELDLEVY
ncbi:MAG: hypothetical protein GY859_03335 [Desulfobacterales bacterium]|nr:hypothetical protein [Desulfobacterales bacterium]